MSKKVKYRVNKAVHGKKVGDQITLEVDANGVPLDKVWRRRVRDAKIDGCLSVVKPERQSKPKPEATKEGDE